MYTRNGLCFGCFGKEVSDDNPTLTVENIMMSHNTS